MTFEKGSHAKSQYISIDFESQKFEHFFWSYWCLHNIVQYEGVSPYREWVHTLFSLILDQNKGQYL